MNDTPLPKTSGPASDAMEVAGIRSLEDLAGWTERDLLALHGVGPKAVRMLRVVMAEHGVEFKAD